MILIKRALLYILLPIIVFFFFRFFFPKLLGNSKNDQLMVQYVFIFQSTKVLPLKCSTFFTAIKCINRKQKQVKKSYC